MSFSGNVVICCLTWFCYFLFQENLSLTSYTVINITDDFPSLMTTLPPGVWKVSQSISSEQHANVFSKRSKRFKKWYHFHLSMTAALYLCFFLFLFSMIRNGGIASVALKLFHQQILKMVMKKEVYHQSRCPCVWQSLTKKKQQQIL